MSNCPVTAVDVFFSVRNSFGSKSTAPTDDTFRSPFIVPRYGNGTSRCPGMAIVNSIALSSKVLNPKVQMHEQIFLPLTDLVKSGF